MGYSRVGLKPNLAGEVNPQTVSTAKWESSSQHT